MRPRRSDFLRAWWRSFAVQGSWNYRTLVGGGIGFALLPLLRRIHAGDPVALREAVARHARSFNAHPYLAAVAVGALARLEHDGADAETLERFRSALRGPLGTLGDRAVWAEWRPLCLLLALLLYTLGAHAALSVGFFLILYNAGHVWLRTWGLRRGWQAGLDIGRLLRESWIERFTGSVWPVNMLLLGAVTVLLARRLVPTGGLASPWLLAAGGVVVALLAFRWPRRGGWLASGLLLSIPVVWVILRVGSG